jgi:hypothetical protein
MRRYVACTLFRPFLVRKSGIPVSLGSSPKRRAVNPALYHDSEPSTRPYFVPSSQYGAWPAGLYLVLWVRLTSCLGRPRGLIGNAERPDKPRRPLVALPLCPQQAKFPAP